MLDNDNSLKKLLYQVNQNLSSFVTLEFEPVGKWFDHYNYYKHQDDIDLIKPESESDSSDDEELIEPPDYLNYISDLDPKNWKDQDHYKVLSLDSLRYKATQHQIKNAYKKKVLKYHPDKQKNSGSKERDYFTCITKAFEILSDPVKRCSFDSVDPTFDDDIPPVNESSKKNFYKVFGEAFEQNSRWSIKKKVPKLGDENSKFEEINDFYSFWYDFDSWREFSYLDEENKETAQDRDERRWIDKQNKAARAKRKKEENTRLRQLVDNAYACDPRIIKFKQEEKRKKEEEKQKKKEAARLREEEELRKQEQERLAKEKKEEEERIRIENEKREKEQQKKLIKKERKTLRTTVKENDYFAENEEQRVGYMERLERFIDILNLNEITKLNEEVKNSENQKETIKNLIFKMMEDIESREENKKTITPAPQAAQQASGESASSNTTTVSAEWCDDEVKLLVKALKVIAVGTRDRWDVVANFIEEHSRGKYKRTSKEILNKTKDMQRIDASAKEEINKKAFEKTLLNIKPESKVLDKPTERYATPGEQVLAEQGTNPAPWSADEQKILEQALKTYPSTLPDRWEKISECLATRSKKDCMMRYKELVEIIQAKKRAQLKAQK